MDQICETVGLSVYRGRDVAQAPYIIGRGGNGKSVFLSVLANAVGEENVSRVDLASIGKRFQTVPLMGKLVNIADDATTSKALEGEGVAKNALSKNAVPYEVKGGATSSFRPWAQFVLSANDYPTLRRADAAMMRRLVFVSFEADFAGRAADTGLEGRLRTEEAASRLLYLGVCALRRLLARDGHLMTRTEDTARSEEELRAGRYLEVVEFSDFQVDSVTGDLFGEIRLAYWHDGESVTPVSGGSISGSMRELAGEMFLSRESAQYDNWRIPASTLVKGITVTGIE
jgi:hypothetical protein